MQKIAINKCYGGFDLSEAAKLYFFKLTGKDFHIFETSRADPFLIQTIEDFKEFGSSVNDDYSEIEIVEIPDDVKWHIEEFDGKEWIAENHRTWS